MKAVLSRKCSTEYIYRKEERSKINDLSFHFKKLEKEGQIKHNISRRKEIIKIRVKVNEIKYKKVIEKNQQNQKLFFEKFKTSCFVLMLPPGHRRGCPETPPGSTLTTHLYGLFNTYPQTLGSQQHHVHWDISQPGAKRRLLGLWCRKPFPWLFHWYL